METTKKCPMCAEEVPLAAVTCEYCGAKFEVTSTGYCQNCHEVYEADGNGQCRVCGNALVDLRVESRLIEEQVQEAVPVSQSIAQPEVPETRKSRLPVGILAGILVLAVISAVLWFGRNSRSETLTQTATPMPTLTFTPTVTVTPSVTPTHTPRPTPTATPLPAWVVDFAQPIIDAIALRAPDFQDDFDDKSGGWRQPEKNPCGQRIEIRDGELVLTDCRAHPANINYADFVAEFDARFLPDTSRRSEWEIFFRLYDTSYTYFGVNYDGSVAIGNLSKIGERLDFPSVAKPGLETNHLLVIAKGSKFAFYMNNQPFYYLESPSVFRQGDIWLANYDGSGSIDLAHPAIVAFDHFKIWNIDDLP